MSHPVHVSFVQVTHIEELPARQAQHAAPTASLAPAVAAALQLRGVAHMFTHQAAAIDELLQVRGIDGLPGLHTVWIQLIACTGKHPAMWRHLKALKLRVALFTHAHTMVPFWQGRHAVVATSTASGKSLCYSVPILQALAQVGW